MYINSKICGQTYLCFSQVNACDVCSGIILVASILPWASTIWEFSTLKKPSRRMTMSVHSSVQATLTQVLPFSGGTVYILLHENISSYHWPCPASLTVGGFSRYLISKDLRVIIKDILIPLFFIDLKFSIFNPPPFFF